MTDRSLLFPPAVKNPLDDIPDGFHKDFINGYMKNWPYPPQTHFRVGQTINVELEGVPQSCVVRLMDCSLIQVVVSVSIQENHSLNSFQLDSWCYLSLLYLFGLRDSY